MTSETPYTQLLGDLKILQADFKSLQKEVKEDSAAATQMQIEHLQYIQTEFTNIQVLLTKHSERGTASKESMLRAFDQIKRLQDELDLNKRETLHKHEAVLARVKDLDEKYIRPMEAKQNQDALWPRLLEKALMVAVGGVIMYLVTKGLS